ncbi:hypothetical protein [Agrococcus sp. DT81.2]|uniref:hypothetical protein n=1 Tax=Agrococcus sp. DT81.2 TaxID=3393414 RepID=UPI003CE4A6F1
MASPDFVMPREAAAPPDASEAARAPAAAASAAGAADDRPPTAAAAAATRRGLPWRHMAIAGLIGALVGAALPAGLQAMEQAEAQADAERLRSTAMAYLTAIAEGEALTATAMVPPRGSGDVTPDAVLRAAAPIAAPEVRLVAIDGDAASVEVRFEVGSRQVTRTLQADRDGESWRLGTSLAEPVALHARATQAPEGTAGVSVGGVVVRPGAGTLFYPGRYRVDLTETGQLRTGGDAFDVDGDPATPTDVFASTTLTAEFADAAAAVARARVGVCQLLAECPIDVDTVARPGDAIAVSEVDPARGTIDLLLPLGLGSGFGGNGQELRLRAQLDQAGTILGWECSEAGDPYGPLEPCAP